MVTTLDVLARRHWDDYQARRPGTCFADAHFEMDLKRAYELQAAVSALRVEAGDKVIGYKVGCTGPGTMAQFGMAGPIRGFIFESEIRRTGVTLDSADFAQLAIEGEMALRIGENGRIVSAFPVIELHHFVFRRPSKTLVELIANNGLQGGIVMPEETWISAASQFRDNGRLTVRIGDHLTESSGLWALPEGAAASIDWLRRHLFEHGLALKSGDIVLAGTPLGLYPVKPGDGVTVLLDGTPAVNCHVASAQLHQGAELPFRRV